MCVCNKATRLYSIFGSFPPPPPPSPIQSAHLVGGASWLVNASIKSITGDAILPIPNVLCSTLRMLGYLYLVLYSGFRSVHSCNCFIFPVLANHSGDERWHAAVFSPTAGPPLGGLRACVVHRQQRTQHITINLHARTYAQYYHVQIHCVTYTHNCIWLSSIPQQPRQCLLNTPWISYSLHDPHSESH